MLLPSDSPPLCASAETPATINVREIMARIRLQTRQASLREEEALRHARQFIPSELSARAPRLHARVETIRENAARIGELPPQPPTLRGRAGAQIVRLIHRSLFWLLPSLRTAHDQVVQALAEQVKINEEMMKAIEQAHVRISGLQGQPGTAPEWPQTGGGK
jgi:hypothetical protein